MSSQPSAVQFHISILRWYAVYGRSFPWRRTTNPYRILLSEIMAQQTQVGRVAEYYPRWLKQFPSFTALSNAPAAVVLRAWSGLGYNSRALRFHRLAKTVVNEFRSRLPHDPQQLLALPGIGRYTAHAVSCFAFGARVPVVDVNIRRIITRWTRPVKTTAEVLSEHDAWSTAEQFLPAKKYYHWNQALMDLGALICSPRNPKCNECPVSNYCASAYSSVFLQNTVSVKKNEPSWKGVPRRLYRGRILKMLHHHALSAEEIASSLWSDPADRDIAWVATLLQSMQRDGLLSLRGNSFRIIAS